jgi:negative regulator of sigma E activity
VSDGDRRDGHLDETALSAMIDGEADRQQAAHVASCTECLDRLARWEAARALVSAPVTPPEAEVRQAAIAAALAGSEATRVMPSKPAPILVARRRRLAPILTAVAAAVVVGAVVAAVAHGGNHPSSSKASSAGVPAESTVLGPGAGSKSPVAGSAATSPAGSAGGASSAPNPTSNDKSTSGQAGVSLSPGLGTFATPQALANRLQTLAAHPPTPAPALPSSPPCQAQAASAAGNRRTVPSLVAPLTYEGRPAEVYVYGNLAIVLQVHGCSPLGRLIF